MVARCIANDISIYSPHTTLDSTVGGINDRVLAALSMTNFKNQTKCPSFGTNTKSLYLLLYYI